MQNIFTIDTTFTDCLTPDSIAENYTRQVPNAFYSWVTPERFDKPTLISISSEMSEELGLSKEFCESNDFVKIFSGQKLIPGTRSYAMNYGGHQFGNWAGQLGDGRAIILGDVEGSSGRKWSLQLKGAGPTPYSRQGDGLAVLRSSVREFLCSEAMHHLGVPTTRALSLITSGDEVLRDMFYDGNPAYETGAIVCRMAQSFIRFGNFQLFYYRRENEALKQLIEFVLENYSTELEGDLKTKTLKWFEEVCDKTMAMIVDWMRVGFVHGVMNTDNMSIHGITIDYGPYGWLEDYNPGWTPNTTDSSMRRYCFGEQPQIAQWNLCRLGEALNGVVDDIEALQNILKRAASKFSEAWQLMMMSKLGLDTFNAGDQILLQNLNEVLQTSEIDMTLFYRKLAVWNPNDNVDKLREHFEPAIYDMKNFESNSLTHLESWLTLYANRIDTCSLDRSTREERMNKVNPLYVLRNYIAQLAIDEADDGRNQRIYRTLQVLRNPYEEQSGCEEYAARRPEWARQRAGCSMLSCSS
tara:strand:+ start:603 stop:2177 length:1575 start_codon:yes stop_codon:yes gene_type:complete